MATPAFSAAGTFVEVASTTTLTISHTLSAGETLFVAFNGAYTSFASVSSVKWNTTETMTLIGNANFGSSFRTCQVYGLSGGTTGTHDVVITFNETCNVILGVVFTYSDVNTGTLWDGAQVANSTSSSSPTATVTSESGDLVVYAFVGSEAYGGSTPTNGTERSEQTTANGSFVLMDRAGQASTQVNASLGFADAWGLVAFNLNATAGGASSQPMYAYAQQ